jgi:hypothetical protein
MEKSISPDSFLEKAESLPQDTWQEEWRFRLHEEDSDAQAAVRGYVQFGGRLNAKEHFLPRARIVCKERNLSLVQIKEFVASADMLKNQYTVSAIVTLKRNPEDHETAERRS